MSQARRVNKNLDKYLEEIEARANEGKKEAATQAMEKLAYLSPIRFGPYIKSHQVGIGRTNKKYVPPVMFAGSGGSKILSHAEQTALRRRIRRDRTAKIKSNRIKFDTKIVLSNRTEHAAEVEYIGWTYPTHAVRPYHVYGRTVESMRHQLSGIVRMKMSERVKHSLAVRHKQLGNIW